MTKINEGRRKTALKMTVIPVVATIVSTTLLNKYPVLNHLFAELGLDGGSALTGLVLSGFLWLRDFAKHKIGINILF